MRSVRVSRLVTASRQAVWAVLADFANVDAWYRGVKSSQAVSEKTSGIGATRRCQLAPMGAVDETASEWIEPELLVVVAGAVSGTPIRRALTSFIMVEVGEGRTEVELRFDYEPEQRLLALAYGPALDWWLRRRCLTLLADLGQAARSGADQVS